MLYTDNKCRKCNTDEAFVISTDRMKYGTCRRRSCRACGHRWNTVEINQDSIAHFIQERVNTKTQLTLRTVRRKLSELTEYIDRLEKTIEEDAKVDKIDDNAIRIDRTGPGDRRSSASAK